MSKHIVIVGAGISGLSLLYFLRKKHVSNPNVKITLLEKNDRAGGNIRTVKDEQGLFECGPNGFLAKEPAMLELIKELGLQNELITADQKAKKRFVLVNEELHAFPSSFLSLFNFKPMTFPQKLRIFAEFLIPKGRESNETVYDFTKRRFGVMAARYFMDPMVSGIYGGDSEFLSIQAAFPKIFDYEQRYGSVLCGMKKEGKQSLLKAELKTFRLGMEQLIQALVLASKDSIHLAQPVREIIQAKPYYVVVTERDKYTADELYITTPAHTAGELLGKLHADLAKALGSIEYAPIAVVGLLFDRSAFSNLPEGFGYLVPSTEESPVLGVLVESNIFTGRSQGSRIMLRVMIGGSRNPEYARKAADELIALAIKEVTARFGVSKPPAAKFIVSYLKAIPQYETQYLILKKRILNSVKLFPGLHLMSNYLDGVSVNDCVRNAWEASERLEV